LIRQKRFISPHSGVAVVGVQHDEQLQLRVG
jgi:hypothetical protein